MDSFPWTPHARFRLRGHEQLLRLPFGMRILAAGVQGRHVLGVDPAIPARPEHALEITLIGRPGDGNHAKITLWNGLSGR